MIPLIVPLIDTLKSGLFGLNYIGLDYYYCSNITNSIVHYSLKFYYIH